MSLEVLTERVLLSKVHVCVSLNDSDTYTYNFFIFIKKHSTRCYEKHPEYVSCVAPDQFRYSNSSSHDFLEYWFSSSIKCLPAILTALLAFCIADVISF